jgi:tetratricopeptide (TPR) repeat protein
VLTLDFLAARLERQEDYAGSARVLSRAVGLAPSPRLIAGWAQTASKAGDWEQAERAYALLLERAPEDLTRFRLLAYMGLASAAGRRGDLPSARHYLERALALNPNHREALRLLRQVEIEEQARQ